MTKAQLIASVADKTKMTKKATAEAVNATVAALTEALAAGESVQLVGFGTFKVSERSARVCKNPRTGEKINVPAKKVPVFKAGKALKSVVK
jgi:DNA-binding protein HU-beta